MADISPYIRLYIFKSAWFALKEHTRYDLTPALIEYKNQLAETVIANLKEEFDVDYTLDDLLFINSASSMLKREYYHAQQLLMRGSDISHVGSNPELLQKVVKMLHKENALSVRFENVYLFIRCSDSIYYNEPHVQIQLNKMYLPETELSKQFHDVVFEIINAKKLTVRIVNSIKKVVNQLGVNS